MRRAVPIVFAVFVFCAFAAAEDAVYFSAIREEAKRVTHRSPEDYRLGRKLMEEMRILAAGRKPCFPRPQLYFEDVYWRGGRLWFPEKFWRDRALIANRKFFKRGEDFAPNMAVTFQLMREYDADGCNFFVFKRAKHVYLDAAEKSGLSPDEFKILPTISPTPGSYWEIADDVLKRIHSSPHVLKIGGKPAFLTYCADRRTPEELAEYFAGLRRRGGADISTITDILGVGCSLYLDGFYAEHKAVAATDLLRYLDFLTVHLRQSDGLEYGVYLGGRDLNFPYRYVDEILLPLFAAACAQKEFNGRRVLALKIVGNYTNSNGAQTVYADGTKTLRGYLELCRKHRVDIIQGFEWNENNENTNLEPTVAKPMAYKRIFRFFMGALKGRAPAPLPGDDTSIPNLIVSARRQLGAGEELELELLNVPDGSVGTYRVSVDFLDQSGKAVHSSETLEFDAAHYGDRTLTLFTEKFPDSRFLQPRIKVERKGASRTFAGLPPTVVRGTVAEDHTWFSTPLRNLLKVEGDVRFTPDGNVRPGARWLNVTADLKCDAPLLSAEIVQNSQDIYCFDPCDEYLLRDRTRKLYKLYHRFTGPGKTAFELTVDLPQAERFFTEMVDRKAERVPFSRTRRMTLSQFADDEYFSVPAYTDAVCNLRLRVKRLDGPLAGQTFEREIPMAEVRKCGVVSWVLPDGLHFGVEADPRPQRMALEPDTAEVKFSDRVLADLPDGVVAMRLVSATGRIWWSTAFAAPVSGAKLPVSVLSSRRGPVRFELPSSRVPEIVYDFNSRESGMILPTAAGREFYAHAGAFSSVAIGFEGSYNGYSMGRAYDGAAVTPLWKTYPDGTRSLVLDGETTRAVVFPKTAVPQRHGFTLTFDLLPEDVERPQILWEQNGAARYLNGFRLRLTGGRLALDFRHRTPHKPDSPLFAESNFTSDIPLIPGVRQQVTLRYDGRFAELEANGKKAVFPAEGIGYWLSLSAFGGRDSQRFKGELFGVRIAHSATIEREK